MFAKVRGADFRSAVNQLLSNQASASVCLIVSKGTLKLQASGLVIEEVTIPVLSAEEDGVDEVTVKLTKIISLLNPTEPVTLVYSGEKGANKEVLRSLGSKEAAVLSGFVHIMQGEFSYQAVVLPEKQVRLSMRPDRVQAFPKDTFLRAVSYMKAADGVVNVLGVDAASLEVVNGVACVVYSNTAVTVKLPLPDMALPNAVVRSLAKCVSGKETFVWWLDDMAGAMYLAGSNGTMLAVFVRPVNLTRVRPVLEMEGNDIVSDNCDVTSFTTMLDTVIKAYGKTTLDLSLGSGVGIHVTSPSSMFQAGDAGERFVTMRMTSVQVGVLLRLFGEAKGVKVKKGANYLCLRHREVKLLLSGMIY